MQIPFFVYLFFFIDNYIMIKAYMHKRGDLVVNKKGKLKPKDVAELENEISEQDAEAMRLLDSDPEYMRNVKPGPPVDETDRQDWKSNHPGDRCAIAVSGMGHFRCGV